LRPAGPVSVLISVVICTRNRAPLLARALESVCNQTLSPEVFEIVVVDNGSTDDTPTIAARFAARHPNVRGTAEPLAGLSHARNRGWREAAGEYVGFLDDDGEAPPEWLSVAREIIGRLRPAAFGGPYFASYDSPKPRWWKDTYRAFRPGEEARPLGERDHLSGGNLFLRRDLLAEAGGFDPGLGMAGNRISMGEEIRLLQEIRLRRPDALLYYDPRLYIHHLVHRSKMKWGWLLRYWFAGGRDSWRLSRAAAPAERTGDLLGETWRTLAELAKSALRSVLKRDPERYPYWQNYLFEVTSQHVVALGALRERLARSRWRAVPREEGGDVKAGSAASEDPDVRSGSGPAGR